MDAAANTSSDSSTSRSPGAAAAGGFVPNTERLSAHFTVGEFTFSDKATREGIDNRLPERLLADARRTAEMLERLRSFLSEARGVDVPILLSSGYRCLALNRALKSADSSDHVIANAGDWRAPAFGTPLEVALALAPHLSTLGIGQLIHEFGAWVHTGRRTPLDPVNRVITIDHLGTRPGLLPARAERRA